MLFLGSIYDRLESITLLHLLIFVFLSTVLIALPFISPHKKNISSLRNYHLSPIKIFSPHNLIQISKNFAIILDYFVNTNFSFQFIWSTGFISWILACSFWVLGSKSISLIFTLVSIVLCLLTFFGKPDLDINQLSTLKKNKIGPSVYIFIIAFSVLLMIFFNSLAIGLTSISLFFLFLFDWRFYKKTKPEFTEL